MSEAIGYYEMVEANRRKVGRPSTKTPEIIEEILDRLKQGEPWVSICADQGMPHFGTICDWKERDPEFDEASLRALRDGTHMMAGSCVIIADDPTIDPAHKRPMIDVRLRLIGKWHAKLYGDKVEVQSTITHRTDVLNPDNLSIEERAYLKQVLVASMERQKFRSIEHKAEDEDQ